MPSALLTAAAGLTILWTGQAGFVITTPDDKVIMLDPCLSQTIPRTTYIHDDFPIDPKTFRADYVFCTHDHIDHTDVATLVPLSRASRTTQFYAPPLGVKKMLAAGIDAARTHVVLRGETYEVDANITIEALYADHTHDSVGYLLTIHGMQLVHTGDTLIGFRRYQDKLRRVKGLRPDILFVPINSGYRNPGPADAVNIVQWMQPKVVIPMHYDLIEENTIDPQLFLDAMRKAGATATPVVMEFGGTYRYEP